MPFTIEPAGLALGGTISGNLVITGTLGVQGAVTFDVAQTVTGALTLADDLIFAAVADSWVLESTGVLAYKEPTGSSAARTIRIHNAEGAATRYLEIGVTTFESIIHSRRTAGGGVWPLDIRTDIGTINFQPSGSTTRWNFGVSPYQFAPNAHNSYDIGTTALRVKDYFGAGNLHIWATGSDGLDETPPENFSFIAGNTEIFDAGTLASESLQDGAFAGFTKWSEAGDFAEGTTAYDYLDSTNAGTLTQALADLTIAGKNNRWYKFTYTISNFAGAAVTATITNAFAASAVTLDFSADATYSVVFQSAAAADAADFVISVVSAASDAFTIDDLILKEIIGGDMIVAGRVTGGGTDGIFVNGDGLTIIGGDTASNRIVFDPGTIANNAPAIYLGETEPYTNANWAMRTNTEGFLQISAATSITILQAGTNELASFSSNLSRFKTRVQVDGAADSIQLNVQGFSTQTNPLTNWEKSTGVDVAQMSDDGDFAAYGGVGVANVTEGGTARVTRTTATETHTLSLSTSSVTTTISVPAGAMLIGASLNINTAITDDDGDDTFTAAFSGGSTTNIAPGSSAPTINGKFDTMFVPELTSATTEVTFTPQGTNFAGGVVEIVVYYEVLTSLADV